MPFAQTIELPLDLILYAVAGLAFVLIGAVLTYSIFFSRVDHHYAVGPRYQGHPGGCGLIVIMSILVIAGVAAYVLLPKIAELYPHPEKGTQVEVVQAGGPSSSPSEHPLTTQNINASPDIFEPVKVFQAIPEVYKEQSPTTTEVVQQIQHAASSRQDWAESRARKLRNQGYRNVTVKFNSDGGTHPWRVLSQPIALP